MYRNLVGEFCLLQFEVWEYFKLAILESMQFLNVKRKKNSVRRLRFSTFLHTAHWNFLSLNLEQFMVNVY